MTTFPYKLLSEIASDQDSTEEMKHLVSSIIDTYKKGDLRTAAKLLIALGQILQKHSEIH